jgi:hypothetical protein
MTAKGKKIVSRILTVLSVYATGVVLALGLTAAPAEAGVRIDKNTVMIQESVGGEWQTALRQSVKFLDKYTRTRMVIGPCRAAALRCVTVRYGTPGRKAWVGQCGPGCSPDRAVSRIVVRKTWKGSGPVAAKKRLLTHELAHAFGIEHNDRFTSVMYGWVYRNWTMTPYKFTAGEKRRLRRV